MNPREPIYSYWHKLFENLEYSPIQFYSHVDDAIKARKIPAVRVTRTKYKEGGMLSADREYLVIQRERLQFTICAAPFGTGFFVSLRLTDGGNPDGCGCGCLIALPLVGHLYEYLFRRETIYTIDRRHMYLDAVHGAMVDAIDEMTREKGIKPLTELERRPILGMLAKE